MAQETDNRIISISGELEQILRAVAHVVAKVAGDPQYINNVSLSVNYMRPQYQSQSKTLLRIGVLYGWAVVQWHMRCTQKKWQGPICPLTE